MTTRESYSPLYFLAALGAGGLAVSFFMYLMFGLPHPETAMPNFQHLSSWFASGSLSTLIPAGVGTIGFLTFFGLHLYWLAGNLRAFLLFRKSPEYIEFLRSNNAIQLMAIPLTLAMTVNGAFIAGSLFVPGIWGVIEYLFPVALVAFAAIGLMAIKFLLGFLSSRLVEGHFDCERNNNLSQLLSIFALSMVAVGFAAPAAMSQIGATVAVALILSLLFASAALLLAVIKMVIGFRSMLQYGISQEASVSLWIVIPIFTLLSITAYRLSMALHHSFAVPMPPVFHLVLFSIVLSVILLFGALGYAVMQRNRYFRDFIHGKKRSLASFALICPGVALVVFGNFFINKGLVATGVIDIHGVVYFALYAVLVFVQIKTIATLWQLARKLSVPGWVRAPSGLLANDVEAKGQAT